MAEISTTEALTKLITTASQSNSEHKLYSDEDINMLANDANRKFVSPTSLRLLNRYLKTEGKGRRLQEFLSGSKNPLHFPEFVVAPKEV